MNVKNQATQKTEHINSNETYCLANCQRCKKELKI